MNRFEWEFFRFCSENNLIRDGDRILVSVSGGVDSVVLLHLLHRCRTKINLDLSGVHFNHGVREEAKEDELLVKNLCQERGIAFRSVSLHFESETDFQNSARNLRLKHLQNLKQTLGYERIALAHTLDDLAETVVWRMIRGTSLFGLAPIRILNDDRIRPLLRTKKEKIYEYAKSEGLRWNEDSSNQKTDYTRNFIRLKILPLFREIGGEKYDEKILGLAEDSLKLEQTYSELTTDCKFSEAGLDYSEICKIPEIFAKEKICRYFISFGVRNIRRDRIVQVYELIKSNKGGWSIDLEKGVRAVGQNKKLLVLGKTLSNLEE